MKYFIGLTVAFAVVFAGVFFLKRDLPTVREAEEGKAREEHSLVTPPPPTPAPVMNLSRFPHEQETIAPAAQLLTREQFIALTDKVLERIPRKKDLRKLSAAEAHHVPRALDAVGEGFGRVAEALERQPQFAREAFLFYEKCAIEKDFATPARALCYHNYADLGARNRFSMLGENKVDESVKELAKSLD